MMRAIMIDRGRGAVWALVLSCVMWAACADSGRFEAAAGTYGERSVQIEGETSPRVAADVDSTFFGGTQPLLGRLFGHAEYDSATPVAVISHAFWTERFDARPDVIGSEVQVDGVLHTIVGVMPQYVDVPENVVLWTPRRH
jgi:hypothetical protein